MTGRLSSSLDPAAEVDRVVKVELDPTSKQGDLVAAIRPVADRLLRAYSDARERLKNAVGKKDAEGEKDARDEMGALLLFRNDMGAFVRVYAFLSQIFDYGNTAIEARSIFYRRLIPLPEFGRERDEIDVSKIVLTHHRLTSKGARPMGFEEEGEKLQPLKETGSGSVQDKEKALLAEIVEKLNDLFHGDVTDDDRLIYVNNVIKGKLLESATLAQQAENNTKEQFSNSPALSKAILDAVMDALDAHNTLSRQALDSEIVREGLKDVLLGPGELYESLRTKRPQQAQAPAPD
jgi:type I restriction enzyme R subunit